MKIPSDLRAFVGSLNAAHVKYIIVGGYAVAYHGHPRFTGDIDIFVESTGENGERIASALRDFGFGELNVTAEDFRHSDLVLQLGFPPNRIDVMTSIDGVTFEQAWASRVNAEVDEIPVDFISRELLIQNKRSTGQMKDLADLEQLSNL